MGLDSISDDALVVFIQLQFLFEHLWTCFVGLHQVLDIELYPTFLLQCISKNSRWTHHVSVLVPLGPSLTLVPAVMYQCFKLSFALFTSAFWDIIRPF